GLDYVPVIRQHGLITDTDLLLANLSLDLDLQRIEPLLQVRGVIQVRPAGGTAEFAGDGGDQVEVDVDLCTRLQVAPVQDQFAAADLKVADVARRKLAVRTGLLQSRQFLQLLHVFRDLQSGRQTDHSRRHRLTLFRAAVLDGGRQPDGFTFANLGLA